MSLSGCSTDAKVSTRFEDELVSVKDNTTKLLDNINLLSKQQTNSFENVKKAVINNGDSDLLRISRYATLAIISIILIIQVFKLLKYQYPKKERNGKLPDNWSV